MRLRPLLLAGSRAVAALPAEVRRSGTFALLAALALLARIEDADARFLTQPPRLGLAARLVLLLRARWLLAAPYTGSTRIFSAAREPRERNSPPSRR